jgi:ubiquinone/menaquinone biosynthesis C-methylase UbiE
VQIARQNVRRAALSDRIDVLRMDAHQLAFPDHHFDVVFCNSVLLFLDRERFFPEVVRVLKPGGRLLLFRESLTGNPILAVYRALWPARWKRCAEKLARRLTVREIEKAGRRYFASVEHREFHLFFSILRRFWPWLIHRVIRNTIEYKVRGGKWSRALDQMLLRRFPSLRRFAWVTIVCFAAPAGDAKNS